MQGKYPQKNAVIVIAFLAVALVMGLMLYSRYRQASEPHQPTVPADRGSRIITLFFPDAEYNSIVREGREIEPCGDTVSCVKEILLELRNGPVGDLSPALPEGSPIPQVSYHAGEINVDLSPDFVSAIDGGSSEELYVVYSIVNSIAVTLPEVHSVRFTVDGNPAETLKGHVDIRDPLKFDGSYEKTFVMQRYSSDTKNEGGKR